MIKEEYVSFEVARLLKDKGFNEPTIGTYNIESKNPILVERPIRAIHCEAIISAPTQAMAMMWLREVHNIHIMIDCIGKINYDPIVQRFDGKDFKIEGTEVGVTKRINGKWVNVRRGFKTYEDACEAAIKYTLEHLI